MERGEAGQKYIKREQEERIQAADTDIPPGFTHPAPQRFLQGTSGLNPQEIMRPGRISPKEYSRRYRQKKKAELEDLKQEIESLRQERQYLQGENVHLKEKLNNIKMILETPHSPPQGPC